MAIQFPQTIKGRLVQLCRAGIKSPQHKLRADEGHHSRLPVNEWRVGNAKHRPIKKSKVQSLESGRKRYSPPSHLLPLFGVLLLRITPKGLLLRGFQCASGPEGVTHHAQE
ncbi:MAG: hypothetical protein JNJ44_11550 [Zoogloeaceae bacterium]|nr:hypothetical protein [Zoogloeaceae bacterium]